MSENEKVTSKNDQEMEKVSGGVGDKDPRDVKCFKCGHVFSWTPGDPWRCPKCDSYMSK